VFRAWAKFSKNPANSYRDFLTSGYEEGSELNNIMEGYDARLERIRRANADVFRTTPKAAAPTAPSPAAPAGPASQAPKGETYSERLKRLQKSGG